MDKAVFPIVGIGASAGGIEALEGFFRGLPANPGLAIVIVTHLSPERESLLHEVVERLTTMSVTTISDDVEVKPDCVFVLTSSAILTIRERRLLVRKDGPRRERKPIDIFFSSLAIDVGETAAGVVLSGGDGDGTLGIKAIKERGGLTLAQAGGDYGPGHPDMPESAIATGFVDFAIPVEQMGEKLVEFARGNLLFEGLLGKSLQHDDEEREIHNSMPEIYGILRNQMGHDFSGYKAKTFMRRVLRRMQVTQHRTVEGYVERLRQEPQEVNALFRDLLINVTNFFRDAEAFESLASLVVPKLFEGRGADDTVRVWIPGCSTGEEVFSIAMLFREHMDRLSALPRVQIFATDIDERALAVARAARYPEALLDSVSSERRRRFFIPDGGSYIVSKDVREICIFSPHSVIRDPPFSRIDLVSCRNLLIYFGVDVQNQVIPTFHYALRPDGVLFLGSAENVSQFEELFVPIEKKHRIFRRRSDVASGIRLPTFINTLKPGQVSDLIPRRPPLSGLLLRQTVDEHVLERFSPAHVVVNRDGDVVFYSTKTGKYLEAPPGAPTRQLLTLARKGLRLDLRTAFREAVESGRNASREGVAVESEAGGVQLVDILVESLGENGSEPLYLIVFLDHGPVVRDNLLVRASSAQQGVALHVERELRETRDRLQSMIEEYETALEELKSSNEELVSVNEEMQSTNEELEASKEELQSVNEELHTVNAELSSKVEALDRANSDLQNLFESTDVATIFLDKALTIRSFTPTVARIFNILPGDRGRPITDLSSRLSLAGFADDIARVLDSGGTFERRVKTDDGATHYLVRLSPYRGGHREAEGVVIAFIDITNITRAEARQNVLISELQHRTRNLLTVVQSMAHRTIGKGGTLDELSARLSALGRLQSLVSSGSSDTVDLRDLIRFELEAIGAFDGGKVRVIGTSVSLDFDLVQTLGLALHELTTNALKYGALKHPSGSLTISWDVRHGPDMPGLLILDWKEAGVPITEAPVRKGFGRELIERALVLSLHAKSEMTFEPDGLACHIELPLPPPPDISPR